MATTVAIPNCLLNSSPILRMASHHLKQTAAQDNSAASLPCMGFARPSLQPTSLDSDANGLLDDFLFSPRPYLDDPVALFAHPAKNDSSQMPFPSTDSAGHPRVSRNGLAPDPRSPASAAPGSLLSMGQLVIPGLDVQACQPTLSAPLYKTAGIGSIPRPALVSATAVAATTSATLSPSPQQSQPVLGRSSRLGSPGQQMGVRDSRSTTPISHHSMSPPTSRELPKVVQGPLCLGGMDVPLAVRVPSAARGALKPTSQGGARSSQPNSRGSSAGGLFPATMSPPPSTSFASTTTQSSVPKLPRLRPAPTKASTFNLGSVPAGRPALGLARSRLMASAVAHDMAPLHEGSSERSGKGSSESRTRDTCRSFSLDGSEPVNGRECSERSDWVSWHMDRRHRLERQHDLRDAAMAESGRSQPDSMLRTLLSTDLSDVTDALLTTIAPSEGLTPRPVHTPLQHAPAQGLGPTSPSRPGSSENNGGRFLGLAPKPPPRAADTLSLAMMMRQKQQASVKQPGLTPSGRLTSLTAGGALPTSPAPPKVPRAEYPAKSSPLTRLQGRMVSSSQASSSLMLVGSDSLYLEMAEDPTAA